MKNNQAALVDDAFECALNDILAHAYVSRNVEVSSSVNDAPVLTGSHETPPILAIAYSGGLDSSVLLCLAHKFSIKYGFSLCALHIHHAISSNSDTWLAHCEAQCRQLDVTFDAQKIIVAKSARNGLEEAARIGRYAALGELCRKHSVSILLTAHHQDDQAETVLLQLLRGSGMAGLSGMDILNVAPDLLGDASLKMARPLLRATRAELEAFAVENNIHFIEDESNSDLRYARNALRHTVIPVLEKSFPGFQERLARTARHAQSAQSLLIALAEQDLHDCQDGDCLNIEPLRKLSPDRANNLLRYWFGSHGVRMPSTAWLREMLSQLLEAKGDAQLCVTHADCNIRRYRNRIFITPKLDVSGPGVAPGLFRWSGEKQIFFPMYGGTLCFDWSEKGVDADWLRNETLTIRLRCGGERMKLAFNRPTKSLKYHYQAFNVPSWERGRLPIITVSNGAVLFAAGIGMDCHRNLDMPGQKILLRWQVGDM